jgi:predicted metal-binding protein
MVQKTIIKQLISEALQLGANQAKIIPASSIVVDERVRLKCLAPLCDKFNQHLMCPPDLPSVQEFKKLLRNIRKRYLYNWPLRRKGSFQKQRCEDMDFRFTKLSINWREKPFL